MSTIPNGPGTDAGRSETEQQGASAPATERLAERAHRTIDGAAASAAEAERELRRGASEAADRVRHSEEQLADAVDRNIAKVRDYIENNPVQSAGIAFVAGMVLSSLLRR